MKPNVQILPNQKMNNSGMISNISSTDSESDGYASEVDVMFVYYLFVVATPVIFAIIIVIGTVGNFLVIIVIIVDHKMKNLTNILLLNLALADITFLLTCVSFKAYKFASLVTNFNDATCKLVAYSEYVTVYVTVYTLMAVAFLRYCTVVKSQSTMRFRTKKNIITLAILIWVIMLVLNIPIMFGHRLNSYTSQKGVMKYCGIVSNLTKLIFISFFLCGYIIPLLIISLLYLFIVHHLKQHEHAQNSVDKSIRQQRNTKALKVIAIVVIVFGISWLPLHVHYLVAAFGSTPGGKFYEVLRILWYCMAYANSLANPFIYTFASSDFRASLKKLLMSKCCLSKSRCVTKNLSTTTVGLTGQSTVCKRHLEDNEVTPLKQTADVAL